MSSSSSSSGIGFWGLLQITFVVLKLLGIITWPWWQVLLPSIISASLVTLVLLLVLVWSAIATLSK